jgi:hypothetical protein
VSAPLVDLTEVTKTAEVQVDGHELWVRPGCTCGGRYWQVLTTGDVPLGMVVERRTDAGPLFEALVPSAGGPSVSSVDAVRLVVTYKQPSAS